jgi:hypothetical protein
MQPERDEGSRADESLRPISGYAVSSAWSHASATRYVRSSTRSPIDVMCVAAANPCGQADSIA